MRLREREEDAVLRKRPVPMRPDFHSHPGIRVGVLWGSDESDHLREALRAFLAHPPKTFPPDPGPNARAMHSHTSYIQLLYQVG